MAIKNYEVLDFIRDEIKDVQAIKDYCNTTFSQSNIHIFIGADERKPPESWDTYPVVVICPLPKDMGEANPQNDYGFMVTVLISGDKKPIVNGNITTYTGIYYIEELSSIILNHLELSFGEKTNVDGLSITYISAPILNFPIIEADIVVKFSMTNAIGDDCALLRG